MAVRSTSTFRAETPLGQDVQQLLLKEGAAGLSASQIRRLLRAQGRHVSEENLRELLGDGRVFVLRADGHYALTTTPLHSAAANEPPTMPYTNPTRLWPLPLLVSVPLTLHNYVVFDIETTGIDPQEDCILQIAAIKVIDGVPTDWFNCYVNPGQREISYALRFVLGIDRDPTIEQRIRAAETIGQVLPRFLHFGAGLPLVAHNARFDGAMLLAALHQDQLSVPLVDTMELALLAAPELTSYRLGDLAIHLGVPVDSLADESAAFFATNEAQAADTQSAAPTVASATFHNALTDVYITYRVYQRLLETLSMPGERTALLGELLPELYAAGASFKTLAPERIASFAEACPWNHPPTPVIQEYTPASPAQLLQKVLAARTRQPRPAQQAMQILLVEAMSEDRFAMIEAPTGTGKTLAYLTAAVYAARTEGRRIALSTAYRNLQDQLIDEIDELHQHGATPFCSQILKGVANYFCWSKIARYGEEGAWGGEDQLLGLDERFVLAYLILRLPHTRSGTLDELSFWVQESFPNARAVLHQLRASAACGLSSQPLCTHCPMPAAYANAQQADILVINHALWLRAPQRLPAFDGLVLDEAHTLEDVATNSLTQEVSSTTLYDALTRLWDARTGRGLLARIRKSASGHHDLVSATEGAFAALHRVANYLPEFGPFVAQFIRRCTQQVDPRYGASLRLEAPPWKIHPTRWQDLNQAHRQLFGIYLKDLLDALHHLVGAFNVTTTVAYGNAHRRELGEIIEELTEQRQLAYEIIKVAQVKLVYWLEVGPPPDPQANTRDSQPSSWAFKVAPVDVGEALQPFYDKHRTISFVSATLAVGHNDFGFFIERLGLVGRLDARFVCKLPPALAYDQNVFFGMVDYLTYAPLQNTMASFKEELANELKLFLRFTDGRALGLFTARQRMQEIAARIGPELARLSLPLFVQTPDSSRRRLLEDFRERKEATLFGLRSFWEGVDVRGESLSFVLLEKLPFPLLTEPVHRARAEHLLANGKSEFDDYMLPLTALSSPTIIAKIS